MEKINLPSINELEDIRNSIFKSNDTTYVKEQIQKLVEYNSKILLNFPINGDFQLWRGRSDKECGLEGYNNFRDLHIPPTDVLKVPNRYNQPNKQMLYTAYNHHIALAEINAQPGQYAHLIKYKIKHENQLESFVLGEYSNLHGKGKTNLFNKDTNKKLNEIYLKLMKTQDIEISLIYLDKLLSSIMNYSYSESDTIKYLHTNALIESIMKYKPNINCIVYPSSAFDGGINFALDKNAADNIIEPQETVLVKVKNKFSFNLYDIDIVRRSYEFSKTGDIIWS